MPTMQSMRAEIKTVHPDRIIDLRHAVLRYGYGRETAMFDGDHEPDSVHIAALLNDAVVGCASLHQRAFDEVHKKAWQLRGMAVHPDHRQSGIGRNIMAAIENHVQQTSYSKVLWCNARSIALPFYQRNGWEIVSDEYHIPTAGPHYKMRKLLANP